jgi:hypothetical protein
MSSVKYPDAAYDKGVRPLLSLVSISVALFPIRISTRLAPLARDVAHDSGVRPLLSLAFISAPNFS